MRKKYLGTVVYPDGSKAEIVVLEEMAAIWYVYVPTTRKLKFHFED